MTSLAPALLCEPQFKRATHSRFNAALLEALRQAWPEHPAEMLCELEHGRWVRSALAAARRSADVAVHEIEVPGALRRVGRARRTFQEVGVVTGALRRARAAGAPVLVFSSVTRLGILLLKVLPPLLAPRLSVLAVTHQLGQLIPFAPEAGRRLSLRWLLALPHPRRVKLLALGAPLHANLLERYPRIGSRFGRIEPPHLWDADCCDDRSRARRAESSAPRFGLFGSGRGGRLEAFSQLADGVRREHPKAEFVLVGHAPADVLQRLAESPVEGLGSRPLSAEEFQRRGNSIDFAVWLRRPEDGGLTLSASFLDALSFVKPTLCERTSVTEHYFSTLGDIGYLCSDRAEIERRAKALAGSFPRDRYSNWQETILKARAAFSPARASTSLRPPW